MQRVRVRGELDADDGTEFFDGSGALLESGVFFGCELDLDNLFETGCTQFAGDSDVVAVDAIFALEVGGAGDDLLFVFEDGFDHLDCGCRGGVVSAAGLEVLDDFSAAVAGALDEFFKAGGRDEFGDGNSGDGGIAGKGDHGVAVAAEDERRNILDTHIQLSSNKGPE